MAVDSYAMQSHAVIVAHSHVMLPYSVIVALIYILVTIYKLHKLCRFEKRLPLLQRLFLICNVKK